MLLFRVSSDTSGMGVENIYALSNKLWAGFGRWQLLRCQCCSATMVAMTVSPTPVSTSECQILDS